MYYVQIPYLVLNQDKTNTHALYPDQQNEPSKVIVKQKCVLKKQNNRNSYFRKKL